MSKFTQLDSSVLAALFATRHTCRYQELPVKGPAVIAFWHDELLPFVHILRQQNTIALVSGKRAGKALADNMEKMGHKIVHGSSSRDGIKAVRTLLKKLDNEIIMVACDGPRGPRHKMKPGALFIAEKAGVPLYLARAKYKGWRLNQSWDKFLVPYPFASVKFFLQEFNYHTDYNNQDEKLAAAEETLTNMICS